MTFVAPYTGDFVTNVYISEGDTRGDYLPDEIIDRPERNYEHSIDFKRLVHVAPTANARAPINARLTHVCPGPRAHNG